MPAVHELARTFERFAQLECKGSSALYHELSQAVARDEALLRIAGQAASGQPAPNLLFAAVHFLLRQQTDHPLARYYASLCAAPKEPSAAYQDFREFVFGHEAQIVALLRTRLVQTNEVRRSAYLFPAIQEAASHFRARPMALIEVGTSGGLNLLCDRYQYTYNDEYKVGDLRSSMHIRSVFVGARPDLDRLFPTISHRIGLDLNIVDLTQADQVEWLNALVWPEHAERRALLATAMQYFRGDELDLRAGDGFAMLGDVVREIPEAIVLCIFHTHVANQISPADRDRLLQVIDDLGARRDLVHLHNDIHPTLHLTRYRRGQRVDQTLAKVDGHARWIEWLAT